MGLVDQNIPLRIVSADARAESLRLGPIQASVHPPLRGLTGGRRMERLLDALSSQPPTIVHAVSSESYRSAASIASEFEADLVLGITSLEDVEESGRYRDRGHASFQPWSMALAGVLDGRWRVDRSRVEVIAPGVPTSAKAASFAESGRTPTLISTSPFDGSEGLERLILAVEMLVRREVELQVFLLGEGVRERALRKLVRVKKLSSCVAFAPRLDDPSSALCGADVFVHPVSAAVFPADTLAAMGLGLAVVTGPDEVCDHHRGVEIVRVCGDGSAEALAEAIDGLLRDRPGAQRLAAAGLEYVRRNHGVSAMAERVAAMYRRLALQQSTFSIRGS